ncbi:MAG: nucleoside transporter, partial [Phycisphaerales bacterium]|nr:nucleoside transporter [Phycisphaerales bacterium]
MTSTQTDRTLTGLDKLYEFEREPVSADKLQPGRYFAGLFAGEHVAATEFVIGVTFVNWGVRAYDVFVGLLIGNLLAVLSWALICTPIAVQTRLTLYWYLRRIAGPLTTTLYNILNAVLFCILAGCMITIASSAVRIPFGIGDQVQWYPEDLRFVAVVLLVGTVVVTLAILGFTKLAQFATVCSPWLLLMFLVGAIAALPGLATAAGLETIRSFGDFWTIAKQVIWAGTLPDGSVQTSMGFWQVAAFAWICNLATHAGLSDMALFRYAKRSSYGLYSALGMYLGHYLAWICAGVMGAAAALAVGKNLSDMD